jgi:hypothetical protein
MSRILESRWTARVGGPLGRKRGATLSGGPSRFLSGPGFYCSEFAKTLYLLSSVISWRYSPALAPGSHAT